jgi:hypothetical protein
VDCRALPLTAVPARLGPATTMTSIATRCLLFCAALLLAPLAALAGQDAPKPPTGIASLAQALARKAAPPTDQPTRFRPRRKPVSLDAIADALGQDADQSTALRTLFQEGVPAIEAKLAEAGHPNDVAAALTFAIAVNWGTWKGSEVSDPASEALLGQLRGALDTAEFRALADVDKQRSYEYALAMGLFSMAMVEAAAGDEATLAGVREFARQSLQQLLAADPAVLELGDQGLQASAAESAEPVADAAPLTFTAPAEWQREDDADFTTFTRTLATRNRHNEPLVARVLVSKAGGTADDTDASLHLFYDKLVRPLIPADAMVAGVVIKDARPEVCRRLIGNGLRCHFVGVSWSKREDGLDYFGTEQELHLYLVESGAAWYPIVVQFTGMKGEVVDAGPTVYGSARHDWLEQLWSTAKGAAGKRPLFDPAEIHGAWRLSSSTAGPFYYSATTGASLGMGIVVRDNRLDYRTDGTYRQVFVGGSGIGTVNIGKETTNGEWRLETDAIGTFVVRTWPGGRDTRARLISAYKLPDGTRVLVELLGSDAPTLPRLWGSPDRYALAPK